MNNNFHSRIKPRTRKPASTHVDCHVAKPTIEDQLKDLDPRNPIDRFMMATICEGSPIDRKTAIALVDAICDVVTDDLKDTGCSKSPLGEIVFEHYSYIGYFRFEPDDNVWMTAFTPIGDKSTARFAARVREKIRPTADIETHEVSRLISMYLFGIYDIISTGTEKRRCMIGTSEETKLGDAYLETTSDGRNRVTMAPSKNLLNAVTGTDKHKESTTNSESSNEFCPWDNSYRFEKIVLDFVIEELARKVTAWVPVGEAFWSTLLHTRCITLNVDDHNPINTMPDSLRERLVSEYGYGTSAKHLESLMDRYTKAIHSWWCKYSIKSTERVDWLVDRWKYVNGKIHDTEDTKEDDE